MTHSPGHAEHPSVFGAVARWWWNWRHPEFDALSGEDIDRIAKDVGVSASELRLLMRHTDDDAHLLRDRMALLHIDPREVCWLDGAVLKDMQRACSLCDSRAVCARDLARGADGLSASDWRDYCPNAATLNAIATLKVCSAGAEISEENNPPA